MIQDPISGSAEGDATRLDPCGHKRAAYGTGNAAFRHHHVGHLLHRIGMALPRLLHGQDLIRESRAIEQMCWRELEYENQPIFDGVLPDFLLINRAGRPVHFSIPTDPVILAARMAALKPSPLPALSRVGTNLEGLARLLDFTAFEFQWLLWSYCVRCFGSAILPVVPLRDELHGCEVLALLADMPVGAVQDAVESRRLHTLGLLHGGDTDTAMPSVVSGWLLATEQFADWIEQPYASDSDLLIALCQAQVSLTPSR
ncbi:hypothetical protein [Acidovorax sp. HMWF018]|uniref:hypothetical protein n=1 Tax=Acidovorax sp. HMWF018 TaxID=2056855 RepID=UPI0011B205E8|nr:hypothetical protein [Acidovorax sp. HMWF018]